jgi:hypothetical protein
MCPLARKKFIRMVAVWTQIGECVTSAEGRDPYSDYSVTLRRTTSCMLLASYKRQNSCELHHHRRFRRDPNKSRKTVLRRLLHQNLERNIHKLCKRLPHLTIHTYHLPQTFPFCLAKLHSHPVSHKSRQFPFIPPQNEQDALTNLHLPWKGCTNGPPHLDGMQPVL